MVVFSFYKEINKTGTLVHQVEGTNSQGQAAHDLEDPRPTNQRIEGWREQIAEHYPEELNDATVDLPKQNKVEEGFHSRTAEDSNDITVNQPDENGSSENTAGVNKEEQQEHLNEGA